MTREVGFKENIATVKGINTQRKNVEFSLCPQEIKHIRRTLIMWDRVFSRDYQDPLIISRNITKALFFKFLLFGRIKRRMNTKAKRRKIKAKGFICSFEGCEEKDYLTVDHIKRLNNEEKANVKKNLRLLCPKHHLLRELKTHLFHKNLEIKKIEKRIEDIEKKGTTDCLGYRVLSKDKFINEEEGNEN